MNGKEYIVDGAICICKYGTAPGRIKVENQRSAYMNSGKPTATTLTLGNVFYPPAFAICKASWPPRPCTPAVTLWQNAYMKLEIETGGYALTDQSKGTCAAGGPMCIDIVQTGQIPLPGSGQMLSATAALQSEMDPLGESVALTENQIDTLLDIYNT